MGCCNVVATLSMAVLTACRNCAVLEQCMQGLCGMLGFKLCCRILLLLNLADMGRLLCVRLWSEQN